ncbi:hypothetical protein BDV28DRAFT_72153 [Aspergillus coremiiformis]|uniref:Annexin n=1 Tax=Aspergillus coremiiformis TaxID=138285 RepID=A0A5N6YWE6_9EURO|nr:hypothetical protein BDV28DRAFT_72153 [Aspergillus coremiiformis]
MSYHHPYPPPNQPPYPPYGAPQAHPHPPYPQQPNPGYGGPPPGQYNRPPPAHPGQYDRPPLAPPRQASYPPHGQPPAGPGYHSPHPSHPPYGAPPQPFPPQGGVGYPPGPQPGPYGGGPVGGYPSQYPPQQFHSAPPSQPSLGYIPGQLAPGDFRQEADGLRKAMKGFGTDEKSLIQILSRVDALQMATIRQTYSNHIRRDLYKDVKSETSGYFRDGLLAVIDGPLMHDVTSAREALKGFGTKEWLLDDVLVGRSNADLNAIKAAYERTYGRSLEKDVQSDLSFETQNLFGMILRANRHEESFPVDPRTTEEETKSLHSATAARVRNNVQEVCGIFARSSNNELRAISQTFSARYNASLEKHIDKEFSGHMKDVLLQMLRGALDPAMRDAELLEDCMKGMGTKDDKLVRRVVRVHWDRAHKDQVKRAYHHRFGKDLMERVRGETSGDYQRLMVALLE